MQKVTSVKTQTSHAGPPVGTRLVAWLNIAVQTTLPLTLAMATPGATASPSKPSSSLQPLPELGSPDQDTTTTAEDQQARKLATLASDTGSFLSSNPDGEAAASMARGLATGEASGQAQAWLSRFGTARVQVDVDDKLSLKNSQVELLAPLHDTPEQLLFAQGSVHRKDERQQASLGLGVRRFHDGYMLGANSFLDQDLSRGHSRLGLGVEYWRDFLKVNANSYQRLTGWKDSSDVEDYQERPANAWDIRTEAWLPFMPQLGGKLTYEQYYGDEVGLFGKDNRKKDPSALTAGLTYTPIPLLTLSAEQRKGNGADETTFGAEFNYHIGEAWARQVDPAGVGAMRTLAGSRYDLVERNNHIVLEYRKKQVIRMAVAAHVSGMAGETKSLSVWVDSKHPLSHIDWTSPALLQAGGSITHDGGPHYSVVLPGYQSGAQPGNVYTLHGVAVDSKGNRSGRSETRVTVNGPALSTRHSTFTPASTLLPNDGTSRETLTLTVLDEQKQPVDIDPANIQIVKSQVRAGTLADGIKVSEPTRTSPGVYEIVVTAGTAEQTLTLTPTVHGTALTQAVVSTARAQLDPGHSGFSADQATIKADDQETSTLTFSAKDKDNKPVEGIGRHLQFVVTDSKGQVLPPRVTVEDIMENTGVYTAKLRGVSPGHYTVTPYFGGAPVGKLNGNVQLIALPPLEANSRFTMSKSKLPAEGLSSIRLEFRALDALKNPVSGIAKNITFVITDNAGQPASNTRLTEIREINGNSGIYHSTLTGIKAGAVHVTPAVDGLLMTSHKRPLELLPVDIESLNVADHDFPASSKFPTTAFAGALFNVNLKNAATPYAFTWTTNVSWLKPTISAGRFLFTTPPPTASGDITITATSNHGAESHTYSFKISKWYETSDMDLTWADAMRHCTASSLATVSLAEATNNSRARGVGALTPEWKTLFGKGGTGGYHLWLSDRASASEHYALDAGGPNTIVLSDTRDYTALCRRTLK